MEPHQIDPEILAARALQAVAAPGLDVTALPSHEARALADGVAMLLSEPLPDLPRVEDVILRGPQGGLRGRIYAPATPDPRGSLLYVHGGGWFACNVDTHERMLRVLAQATGLAVFAFDYRLSPEHPYPAALADTRAAWRWLRENGPARGIPTGRIAVAGDSAGANLALALALGERDAACEAPAGLALLYGCFAPGIETGSQRRYGDGAYGLSTARMAWYWRNYLGPAGEAPALLATPLHADLRGLPPTFVGVAELDILADENRLLAERLAASGVQVELEVWPHTTHGFLQMTRDVAAARSAVASIARAIRAFIVPGDDCMAGDRPAQPPPDLGM